jgi:hypothetical protein
VTRQPPLPALFFPLLPLTIHESLFTGSFLFFYSPFTLHCSFPGAFSVHRSLLTVHCSPFTAHCSREEAPAEIEKSVSFTFHLNVLQGKLYAAGVAFLKPWGKSPGGVPVFSPILKLAA